MARRWKMVRVPAELAARLESMAGEMERAHASGRARLPAEFVDRVPIHHVIDRALAEMASHRARSRATRRRPARA